MDMPFGKYKGSPLHDIPRGYLQWVLDNLDLRPPLQSAIEHQLGCGLTPPDAIQEWYKRLAQKYHPAIVGNTIAIQAINDAYESLRLEVLGTTDGFSELVGLD